MAEEAATGAPYNGHARLYGEIRRRWLEPQSHPTYGLFFIGSFLIFAAIGIWLELAKLLGIGGDGSASALRTAIATYFPAILGSCMLQLSISESLRSLRVLSQIVGFFFFALAFILVFATRLADWAAIVIGIAASAAALACWWVVNADDPALRDEPVPPEVATGGTNATDPLLGADALQDFEA